MRNIVLILFFLHHSLPCISQDMQKKAIDTSAYNSWPNIGSCSISANGEYVAYSIQNKKNIHKLILHSLKDGWQKEIEDSYDVVFTKNSHLAILKNKGDSLGLLKLGTSTITYIQDVGSFELIGSSKNELIAYTSASVRNKLNLYNLATNTERSLSDIEDYKFSTNGLDVLVKKETIRGANKVYILELIELASGDSKLIYEGKDATNYIFDRFGEQVVFSTIDADNSYSIWLYRIIDEKAIKLTDKHNPRLNNKFIINNGRVSFNNDGTKLMFDLKKIASDSSSLSKGSPNVIIWNYGDAYLPGERIDPPKYSAFLDIKTKEIVFLKQGIRERIQDDDLSSVRGYCLIKDVGASDGFYNIDRGMKLYLFNLSDGNKTLLTEKKMLRGELLSPNENFVIWFDQDSLCWISYNLLTHEKKNISAGIPAALYDKEAVEIGRRYAAFGIAGWGADRNTVYLYDQFDIWKVDLRGINPPLNVTLGKGRKQNIVLSIISFPQDAPEKRIIYPNQEQILSAYDPNTKKNGFWKARIGSHLEVIKRPLEDCVYYIPRVGRIGFVAWKNGMNPIKAANCNRYLISRQSAGNFPNLYVTEDFKSYKKISNLHPESQYNWITAELMNWKMTDGRISQGILYKPENFDPAKKYPLIFDYYEKRSDQLNEFIKPDWSGARINIPYYVSDGYLVFVPDIYHKPGHNGEGVVNAIVSAAKHLSKFNWVDTTKLGLQGHSFAGWETNYLITHTPIFAAACEAAGVSDQISSYLQLNGSGGSRQEPYENGGQGSSYGIGVTPWTDPKLYFNNSPIFSVHNAVTPLLMMHGDQDTGVPWPQAIEMFLSMKRAGKKVWLLQYSKAGHILYNEDARDFTFRMKQFFDHYLKGAPAPRWMTEGIPSGMQGKVDGLELDMAGKEP